MYLRSKILNFIESPLLQIISYYFLIVNNNKLVMPLILLWIFVAILNPFSSKLVALFFIICPLPLFLKHSLKIKILPKMIFKGLSTLSMLIIGSFFLYKNSKEFGIIVTFKEFIPFLIFIFFVVVNVLALISVVNFFIAFLSARLSTKSSQNNGKTSIK